MKLPQELEKFIATFSKLPILGLKTSLRLGLWLIQNQSLVKELVESLLELNNLQICNICRSIKSKDQCQYCDDNSRDRELLCVVEKYSDLFSFERSGFYNGLYFCLGTLWSPVKGVTFDKLPIQQLVEMISRMNTKEVILALPFTLQGDATSKVISDSILAKYPEIKITRLARGLPKGSEIDQVDDYSLSYAFRYRKNEI